MSWKQFVVKSVVGLAVVPSLVGGSFYLLDRNGFFNVDIVEVVLTDSNPPSSTQKAKHFKNQVKTLEKWVAQNRGKSLWSLKFEEISSEVEKLPWVKNSHLTRVWPSTLQLKIQPQTVPLVYRSDRGELFPVLANGMLLDAVPPVEAPDVAVLTGDVFSKKQQMREKAVQMMEAIPQQGSFSQKTISEIGYGVEDGFWMNLIRSHLRVKLGENDFLIKSQRVSKVVDYLETHNFEARVIDANLSQKVLVRLRKDP